MTNLPVREMVLYKHGVGFFVREGDFTGTDVNLTFRADEVNDILKSLAVFDRAGGQVYGVHYQTPMDRHHRLANTSIHLNDEQSITQLIQQLRGRQTLIVVDVNGKETTFIGRIIGVEQQSPQSMDNISGNLYISLMTNDGTVRVFPFENLRQLSIKDEQSQQDLTYFLDTSMSEDNRRQVTVRLSEGNHDLVIYYVAPSPTWRVSYRLVAEADESGTTGKALLQGWGLFDNRLEEDLDNVRVTLVAGQPISFIYDLYASHIPERPVVEDEARIAPGPIEYKGKKLRAPAPAPMAKAMRSAIGALGAAPEADMDTAQFAMAGYEQASHYMSIKDAEQSTAVSSETKETGETFQYIVTTPVTVKRGESALVPILGHTVNYERELLYNRFKLPDHPVAALRFDNQTGLTLERGPVTLVEDGDYRGEAVIPFTPDNNQVYIPYAVELGVKVVEHTQILEELHGISIEKGYIRQEAYDIRQTKYSIENSTDKDKPVTIMEHIGRGYELYETVQPDFENATERRWTLPVPAGGTTEFTSRIRRKEWKNTMIRTLTYYDLNKYLENRYIDNSLIEDLRKIFETIQSIGKMQDEIVSLVRERDELYQKQEQYRKNMGSLGATGKEGTLRQRVVDQLEQSQDRLDGIDRSSADLKRDIEETEKQVNNMIAELSAQT